MSDSPKMQKLRALASVTPTDLAGWGDRLTTLYDLRPRPVKKLFGTRGPTPEQAAEYDAERKLHASLQRKARIEHRKALFISNAAHRAKETP